MNDMKPGERYGILTVADGTFKKDKDGKRIWRCICDCGTERYYPARWLRNGRVKSCGCAQHKPVKDITGMRFGHLTAVRPTGLRDSNAIKWECRCDCGGICYRSYRNLKKGGEKANCGCLNSEIHREIFQKAVHFIDGTCVEKIMSQKPMSNNTSGIRGVHYNSAKKKWIASIGFKGKQHILGGFDSLDEAAAARGRAEQEMHRPFLEAYYAKMNAENILE